MAQINYRSSRPERLDKFLSSFFSWSREKSQKIISNGLVLVNQKKAKKNYNLKLGDKIEVLEAEKRKNGLDLNNISDIKLDIAYQNQDYLVINKPAGLIVHPLRSLQEKTLVTILLNFYPEIKNVGDPSANGLRPGIVHRLDKEVSGLMVIAKTQKAFDYFKKQFQDHKITKEYLVLVHGQVKKEKDIIMAPLASNQYGKTSIAQNVSLEKIKDAWTEYEVIRRFAPTQINADYHADKRGFISDNPRNNQRQSTGKFTLLKVKILTGRTHQIRLHLKSIGHPLVGDQKHKTRESKKINLDRIFLHSHKLGFYDLNGEKKLFTVDLPETLKKFIEKIGGSGS